MLKGRTDERKEVEALGAYPLVTVVVPCYNAEKTVEETLRSISAQTYSNLEIIVVDDGSRDDSAALVENYALLDPRVRLICQANAGVAAARNAAIAEAKGLYVAPVDADDVWRPSKIAKQVEAALSDPEAVGLVYTWYALIDGESKITSLHHKPDFEGDVLEAICRENFVGNGSSCLIRTDLLRRCGGYDASLRARGGQGCEDWRVCVDLAMQAEYRLVPEYLTGYRHTDSNMSSDTLQMYRSAAFVAADVAGQRPELAGVLDRHLEDMAFYLMTRSLSLGRVAAASRHFAECARRSLARTFARLPSVPMQIVRERAPKPIKQQVRRLRAAFGTPKLRVSFYQLEAQMAAVRYAAE